MGISRKTLDLSNTIFALASGSLPSAVAIIRISGPLSFSIAEKIFKTKKKIFGRSNGMWFGELCNGSVFIDEVVVLSFVGPHSQTGEDVIEIQCHGSSAIVREIEKTLLENKARPAERGEFSYRAFLNNKISSSDLDNLGDIFIARQPFDLQRIYQRKDGSIEQAVSSLREQLIRIQAILETAIDFSEEYSQVIEHVNEPLNVSLEECNTIVSRYSAFVSGKSIPRMVLAGKPNAGKSSLFNALLCRYRAIVHDLPGTTRDVIEEDFEVSGKQWKLVDTAGVRQTDKISEKEGIALGENYLGSSSFWLLVVDGVLGLTETDQRLLKDFSQIPHFILWNKMDLPQCLAPPTGCIPISAQTGMGVELLYEELESGLKRLTLEFTGPLPTQTQCNRLKNVVNDLLEIKTLLSHGVPPEILSEKNRSVLQNVENIIGPIETDEILDRIFKSFCIGK